ncbi:hypothetical protein GWK47_008958 [Chionoecetes opilio]|uniref:Uncharacterized protein n=1 Tax=Chionoecetes opilio TaxID=41210 RepID=A0A8J5C467_CHIOP|nr:hypothetical protein GWK47_008958 [Chionoecetes opilio]
MSFTRNIEITSGHRSERRTAAHTLKYVAESHSAAPHTPRPSLPDAPTSAVPLCSPGAGATQLYGTPTSCKSTCPCGFASVVFPPGPSEIPGPQRGYEDRPALPTGRGKCNYTMPRRPTAQPAPVALLLGPQGSRGRGGATKERPTLPQGAGFPWVPPGIPGYDETHAAGFEDPLSTAGLPGGYTADGDVLIIQCMTGRAIKDAPGETVASQGPRGRQGGSPLPGNAGAFTSLGRQAPRRRSELTLTPRVGIFEGALNYTLLAS